MVNVVRAGQEGSPSCENCSKQRESTSHVPSRAEWDYQHADEHDAADDDIPENHQGLPWRKRTTVNRQLLFRIVPHGFRSKNP